jgi:N-methylhydantoinase A/oxoprolinase/acetone carboxylase beta subunit
MRPAAAAAIVASRTTRWPAPCAWSASRAVTIRATSRCSRSAAPARCTPFALARELGIPTVLIPARPGLTNALGCVVADLRHDFVATVNQPLEALDEARIGAVFHAQIVAGRERIAHEQVAVERIVSVHRADMQFHGPEPHPAGRGGRHQHHR